MLIRKESPKDYEGVYQVVKCAFESAEHADGNEQDLVDALRKSDAFIPELSLVAEMDQKIAGHIMFTRATVGDETVLALAPLSVLPGYQRKGIGTALIREGHRIAGGICERVRDRLTHANPTRKVFYMNVLTIPAMSCMMCG